MSRNARITLLIAAVAVVVIGTVIAISSGGSNKASHTSGHAYIYVVNAKPKGGVQLLVYNKGQQVQFTIVSDVADEVHVHGYELKKEVAKGGSVTFSFPATDVGDHVVELESRGEQIANLRVLG
jgi:FlaG/FlaF family flagellin (archaellin)